MQLIENNLKRRMQNIRQKKISEQELKDCCQKVQKPQQPWRHQCYKAQKDARFVTGHVTVKPKHRVQVVVNTSAMIIASCLLVEQNENGSVRR